MRTLVKVSGLCKTILCKSASIYKRKNRLKERGPAGTVHRRVFFFFCARMKKVPGGRVDLPWAHFLGAHGRFSWETNVFDVWYFSNRGKYDENERGEMC